MSTNTITDIFKSLSSYLGYGLPGLAAIMVFTLAYLIIKRKGPVVLFIIFCAFILIFFAYAGVGIAKENKILTDSTRVLSNTNNNLDSSLSITNQKLKVSVIQTQIASNANLPKDTLAGKIDSLIYHLSSLKMKDSTINKKQMDSVTTKFKLLSDSLKTKQLSPENARKTFFANTSRVVSFIK